MNHTRKISLTALLLGVLVPAFALAQDPEPTSAKPNILLIVDSSGSMEYKTGQDTYPTCNPGLPLSTNEKSRWIDVVEVLTGDITEYSCESVSRDTNVFKNEFAMPNGAEPPDADYRNPYHRPLSFGCALTPDRSSTPANAFSWVPPVRAAYPVNPSSLTPCGATFQQSGNGFIDAYSDLVRFGLMTFDTETDDGRGYNSSFGPNYPDGIQGAWSYYGSPAEGKPANCSSLQPMEVGVRNGAAPATEGKMIHFGDPNGDTTADEQRHRQLQDVLLATRPYGATPLNGALNDARYFFWSDDDVDPTDPIAPSPTARKFSPHYDEYVDCGCREQHIILITDGEPNLDLRPDCEESGTMGGDDGVCPFPDDPAEILTNLDNRPPAVLPVAACGAPNFSNRFNIRTHVVGYSTADYNNGSGVKQCDDLRSDEPTWDTPGGVCDTTTNEDMSICCKLHELAAAGSARTGGDQTPYLAPDAAALQNALGDIIKGLINTQGSATQPVSTPGKGLADNTGAVGFRILSSFETTGDKDLSEQDNRGVWRANLERARWTCNGGVPELQPKDETQGDDFALNVSTNVGDRKFITFVPDAVSSQIRPERSIRPYMTGTADGLGSTGGNLRLADGARFTPAQVPAEALGLSLADGQCDGLTNVNACVTRVLGWVQGFPDGVAPPDDRDRCENTGDSDNCSLLGDILHSTPVVVNRPSAPVEDETYTAFAATQKGRMMMAYTSTNDGFLHGFAVSRNSTADPEVNTADNNEHFAFLPPLTLTQVKSQYPDTRMKLLDGTAVTLDVVATPSGGNYLLERDLDASREASNTWRTILVQGFGGEQSGYFALDITDAKEPGAGTGPRFLWQLTTTETPAPLFGTDGTPLITTLAMESGGSVKEVAVAILPGGKGGAETEPCTAAPRPSLTDSLHITESGGPAEPRATAPCYDSADVAARSLTIVRLDSGEIIRSFRNNISEIPGLTRGDGNNPVYLDAPITGIPAAFPAGAGMVSDRVFVGDQQGNMWRVDVSKTDPADWTMTLFYDSFGALGANEGKAIAVKPVLSIDTRGQITINYATGAQDLSGDPGDVNYIYSITEAEDSRVGTSNFYAKVNWYEELSDGEHILGPMNLVAGSLYFSTIDPLSGDACNQPTSYIWGLDYINPELPADPASGGSPAFSLNATSTVVVDKVDAGNLVSGGAGSPGPVFGVSVDYVPSCRTSSGASALDLLGGTRTQVTDPSTSTLELVFHTANASSSSSSGFKTGFSAVTLAPPPTASTILSWAAILD